MAAQVVLVVGVIGGLAYLTQRSPTGSDGQRSKSNQHKQIRMQSIDPQRVDHTFHIDRVGGARDEFERSYMLEDRMTRDKLVRNDDSPTKGSALLQWIQSMVSNKQAKILTFGAHSHLYSDSRHVIYTPDPDRPKVLVGSLTPITNHPQFNKRIPDFAGYSH